MPVIDRKKAKTAGATLVIAAAAGFFMQNGGVPLPGGGAPLTKPALVSAAVPDEPAVDTPPTLDTPPCLPPLRRNRFRKCPC